LVSEVFVSSDDAAILSKASELGAVPIPRPDKYATDIASSEEALIHALEYIETMWDGCVDILAFLQCTSPLLTSEELSAVIASVARGSAECAFTVCENHRFLWRPHPIDGFSGINHDERRSRQLRQTITHQDYIETGGAYVMNAQLFKEHKSRFFGKIMGVPVKGPQWEIDDMLDLRIVEAILTHRD